MAAENTALWSVIFTGILQAILFIALIILVLKLSALIKNLMGKIDTLQTTVMEKVNPILDTAKDISGNVKDITQKVEDSIETVNSTLGNIKTGTGDILQSLKDITEDISQLEKRLSNKIENPVDEIVSQYNAISKGIKTFMSVFKREKKDGDSSFLSEPDENEEIYRDQVYDEYVEINSKLDEVKRKIESLKKTE